MSCNAQNWPHPPLLYNVSGELILPLPSSKNMMVRVVVGETITLSWPGSKVNISESNIVLVKCVEKGMFLLSSTLVDKDQLGCTRTSREKMVSAWKRADTPGHCVPC